MRVAVLEDDLDQGELLSLWLTVAGHRAVAFTHGASLLANLEERWFDALLLDWNVSGMSGLDVLAYVRSRFTTWIPVLFCTGRSECGDIVLALQAGADGYLVKPIRGDELIARMEAIVRRTGPQAAQTKTIELGEFSIDAAMRTIARENVPVALAGAEFDLACLFLTNIGRMLSREYILDILSSIEGLRTLDNYVSHVRRKLKLKPEAGWLLSAVYGRGYRLTRLDPRDAILGSNDSTTRFYLPEPRANLGQVVNA